MKVLLGVAATWFGIAAVAFLLAWAVGGWGNAMEMLKCLWFIAKFSLCMLILVLPLCWDVT